MHTPLESSIKRSIEKRLNSLGAWFQKNAPGLGHRTGRLDFTIIYRGRGFCLEVKRPGPKHSFHTEVGCAHCWRECTPTQKREIVSVIRGGGVAHVVTSADEAEAVLRGYTRG
jgi:hypothetical protein